MQVSDVFYLSLKWQEETNYKCQIFFPPSLNKIKRLPWYSCLENPMDGGPWRATYSPWDHKELDTTSQDPLYTNQKEVSLKILCCQYSILTHIYGT